MDHNKKPFNSKVFIEKARFIHGEKYNYDLVTDFPSSSYIKIPIKCNTHGIFYQEAGNHLKGCGCPRCGKIKVRQSISKPFVAEQFILHAKGIHGNAYDYSLVKDAPASTHLKVDLICVEHGKFSVSAKDHLGKRGGRCPRCSKKESYGEYLIRSILQKNNIQFEIQKKFQTLIDPISKRKLSYDFFIPSKNILIEFDGEYHFYPPNFKKLNENELKIVRERIKLRDTLKNDFAVNNMYNLIRISFEFRNPESIAQILREHKII